MLVTACHYPTLVMFARLALPENTSSPYPRPLGPRESRVAMPGPHPACHLLPHPGHHLHLLPFGELTEGPLSLHLHYGTNSNVRSVRFPTCQSDVTQSALPPGAILQDEIIGTKCVRADSPELGSGAPAGLRGIQLGECPKCTPAPATTAVRREGCLLL